MPVGLQWECIVHRMRFWRCPYCDLSYDDHFSRSLEGKGLAAAGEDVEIAARFYMDFLDWVGDFSVHLHSH
jgi:hypothetical protein